MNGLGISITGLDWSIETGCFQLMNRYLKQCRN